MWAIDEFWLNYRIMDSEFGGHFFGFFQLLLPWVFVIHTLLFIVYAIAHGFGVDLTIEISMRN
jgi:hypothetical protein